MGSIDYKPPLKAGLIVTCAAVIAGGLVRGTFGRDSGATAVETSELIPVSRCAAAVSRMYADEFGESVFRPAVTIPPGPCERKSKAYAVTTAYLDPEGSRSDLLYAYLGRDGSTLYKETRRRVLTPSGRFRVLVMLVRHQSTISEHGITLWREAQNRINRDHEEFALSRGYSIPLVSFENTNVLVDRTQVADPRAPGEVRSAARRMRIEPDNFHLLVSLDLDPFRVEGGFAEPGSRFVYVGNFSGWRSALDASEWLQLARTVYHHEISHHWGWRHEWSLACDNEAPFAPFLTDPTLFGWEDLDDDGVPEIIDKTPYGRSRQ